MSCNKNGACQNCCGTSLSKNKASNYLGFKSLSGGTCRLPQRVKSFTGCFTGFQREILDKIISKEHHIIEDVNESNQKASPEVADGRQILLTLNELGATIETVRGVSEARVTFVDDHGARRLDTSLSEAENDTLWTAATPTAKDVSYGGRPEIALALTSSNASAAVVKVYPDSNRLYVARTLQQASELGLVLSGSIRVKVILG